MSSELKESTSGAVTDWFTSGSRRKRRKVGIFCDKSAVLISGAMQEVMNQ